MSVISHWNFKVSCYTAKTVWYTPQQRWRGLLKMCSRIHYRTDSHLFSTNSFFANEHSKPNCSNIHLALSGKITLYIITLTQQISTPCLGWTYIKQETGQTTMETEEIVWLSLHRFTVHGRDRTWGIVAKALKNKCCNGGQNGIWWRALRSQHGKEDTWDGALNVRRDFQRLRRNNRRKRQIWARTIRQRPESQVQEYLFCTSGQWTGYPKWSARRQNMLVHNPGSSPGEIWSWPHKWRVGRDSRKRPL